MVIYIQKLLAIEVLGNLSPLGERRALRSTYKYSILAWSCTGSIDPFIAALLVLIL